MTRRLLTAYKTFFAQKSERNDTSAFILSTRSWEYVNRCH